MLTLAKARIASSPPQPTQSGALAYGLKLDERLKVAPNAKLRCSLGRMYTKVQRPARGAGRPVVGLGSLPACLHTHQIPDLAPPAPPALAFRQAGASLDHGTALAADLKIRPSSDETARVRPALLLLMLLPGCCSAFRHVRCLCLPCSTCGNFRKQAWPRRAARARARLASALAVCQHSQLPAFLPRPAPRPSQILMGGTAVWQRRDCVLGGNLSTEWRLPKAGGRGGKSDTLCSANAQLNNKGNGQVRCLRGGRAVAAWRRSRARSK